MVNGAEDAERQGPFGKKRIPWRGATKIAVAGVATAAPEALTHNWSSACKAPEGALPAMADGPFVVERN